MAKVVTKKKSPAVAKKASPKKVSAQKASKVASAPAKVVKEAPVVVSNKQDLISQFGTKNGDTGSPEVQVALATHKILNLTAHLEQNPKDNHSRRGLLKVISKRRRIVNYLAEKDNDRYKDLIKKVNLSK